MVARKVVALAALASGCAPKPAHTIPISLLLDGDRAAVGALPQHAVAGLELSPLDLPAPAAAPADAATPLLGEARASYAKGDFDTCRAALAKIDVGAQLAAGARPAAARTLALDTACAWGAMDRSAAQASARRLASFGLELPELPLPPDVERLLGEAAATAGKAPRTALAVTGEVGARLTVDGREAGCALPCTVDLSPGDHVLAVAADGFLPAVQTVRAPEQKQLAIAQQSAPADLAARQWRARVGRGQPATDITGAALLGKLARGGRVAFVHGDRKLTGALVVDGKLVASATRDRGDGTALVRELAYDGGVLKRPALWQRPWFWIAASGAAVLVAGGIVAVTYTPERVTTLRWP